MANETNKNRDDRNEKLDKPGSTSKTKDQLGNAYIPQSQITNEEAENGDVPGITPRGGGRRGNISTEDGGNVSGSSTGSR